MVVTFYANLWIVMFLRVISATDPVPVGPLIRSINPGAGLVLIPFYLVLFLE